MANVVMLAGVESGWHKDCSPSTASSATGGSRNIAWKKRYVNNLTKGISTLLFGNKVHKKNEVAKRNSYISVAIDWTPLTYPQEQPLPPLAFSLCRRSQIMRGSKILPTGPQSIVDSSVPPLLHPHYTVACTELGADAQITRLVEATGVIVIKPLCLERSDLHGRVTHRVLFNETHLLNAVYTKIVGIGETICCLTDAFTVVIYEALNLREVCDLRLWVAENALLRYQRIHTSRSESRNDARLSAVVCPTEFGRRQGIIAVGSTSGFVHLWNILEKRSVCVLPAPISKRQAVVAIGYSSLDEHDYGRDVASPFEKAHVIRSLTRSNYLWVFYADGKATIWKIKSSTNCYSLQQSAAVDTENVVDIGDIPEPLQHYYTAIEEPLRSNSQIQLVQVTTWQLSGRTVIEEVLECGSMVTVVVRCRCTGEYSFIVYHPKCNCDSGIIKIVTFQELGLAQDENYRSNSPIFCHAVVKNVSYIIVVSARTVRIVELHYEARGLMVNKLSQVVYEISATLSVRANIPVTRRAIFSKAVYDCDFGQLLLGLTTGEVVRIPATHLFTFLSR